MRRIALALLLVLTACSQSDRATTVEPSPDSNEGVASSAELQSALLTIDDLPTGWTTAPPEESLPSQGVVDEEGAGICNEKVIDTDEVPASAEVEFAKGGELSNRLVQVVASYDSQREAAQAFEDIEEVMRACTEWEERDAETTSKFTLQSLSFPRLGDDTLAVRMNGDVNFAPDPNEEFSFDLSATMEADVIVVRSSNLIMVLGQLAMGIFGPASLDSSETEDIARAALRRMESI